MAEWATAFLTKMSAVGPSKEAVGSCVCSLSDSQAL